MPTVTVKSKYQVVIPKSVRDELGVKVGDLLEAKVEKGRLIFAPKALVDRGIAQSLDDFRRGRAYGPFATHSEFLASLHAEVKKIRSRKLRRPAE